MGLFTVFGQNRKLKEVAEELERLGRAFKQLEMEWDAVQDRVSKVLRRLARERQAEEAAGSSDCVIEGGEKTPFSSLATPPDWMSLFRPQPACPGKGGAW